MCSALNCVTHGSTIIFPSAAFDARAMLVAIQKEKATVATGVPTMFIAQLQHPDFPQFDVSSLRAALIGGAPCPVELLRRMNAEMHCEEVSVVYGQTEASVDLARLAGLVPAGVICEIMNPDGTMARVPQLEEFCRHHGLKIISVAQLIRYLPPPEPHPAANGDLGLECEDGHFHIAGRSKEMIIRGGENIYPAEIESFLFGHPKVGDVTVLGLPDLKLGEVVAAWIRPKAHEMLTAEEVREYCQGKIAHFKIPQYVRIVDSFPMTVTGKVQKFRIRQMEIEALGLEGQVAATA